MWIRERIIELRLVPMNCLKFKFCKEHGDCTDCINEEAEFFADKIIETGKFDFDSTSKEIMEKKINKKFLYAAEARATITDYIQADFKEIFNELGDKNVE